MTFLDGVEIGETEVGTSTAEMFRVVVAEIARTGKVPVDLKVSESDGLVDVPRRNKIWSWFGDAQS